MGTKLKKPSSEKQQKKAKTVGILAGLVTALCVLDEIFAIIWWREVDWLETCILIAIILFSLCLFVSYKKKNQRSVGILAGVVIISALFYHVVYLSNIMPFLMPFFGMNILSTLSVIFDFIILLALIVFACVYFINISKNNKSIYAGRGFSIAVFIVAICAIITNIVAINQLPSVDKISDNLLELEATEALPAVDVEELSSNIETTRFAIIGELVCYYLLIAAVIGLVQKTDE